VRRSRPIWDAFVASKDPTTFMVLFEDSAALVGIVIATIATALSITLEKPWIDGAGSIGIGIVLAAVAVLLARESKALLIGERARPELSRSIREIALHQPGVISVSGILTSQLSPDQVIANVGVEFADNLRTADIEKLIGNLETELRKKHPDLFRVFVRPHPDRYQGEVGLLDVGPGQAKARE
jgi:divalent metal cation (Fe/Co/Zn/Cd) transporter